MDSKTVEKHRSVAALGSPTARTERGQWGERVMVLLPFDEFWKEMESALLLAMQAPRRSGFALTEKEEVVAKQEMHRLRIPLKQFKHGLYGIAEWMISIKNDLALQSIALPEIRRLGKCFDRTLKSVRESRKLLTSASTIATAELVPNVNGGIPEFARIVKALERLESRLSKLRSAVAATIPPKERNRKDRNLAPYSPWKTFHELAALTKSIRALDYVVVYFIEGELTKFSRLPFSSHGTDKLIARFFCLANNGNVEDTSRHSPSEENIKLMRHKLRTGAQTVPKWLSDQFPPPHSYKKRKLSLKNQANS